MSIPGYNGQVVGRDCNCEDFPCCGHGLTMADIQDQNEAMSLREMYERGVSIPIDDEDTEFGYEECSSCDKDVREDQVHMHSEGEAVPICAACCDCGGTTRCGNYKDNE